MTLSLRDTSPLVSMHDEAEPGENEKKDGCHASLSWRVNYGKITGENWKVAHVSAASKLVHAPYTFKPVCKLSWFCCYIRAWRRLQEAFSKETMPSDIGRDGNHTLEMKPEDHLPLISGSHVQWESRFHAKSRGPNSWKAREVGREKQLAGCITYVLHPMPTHFNSVLGTTSQRDYVNERHPERGWGECSLRTHM